jgi:hypothetical protein
MQDAMEGNDSDLIDPLAGIDIGALNDAMARY